MLCKPSAVVHRLAGIINIKLVIYQGLFVLVHVSKNAQLLVFLLDFLFTFHHLFRRGPHMGHFSATSCLVFSILLGICEQNGKGVLNQPVIEDTLQNL